MPGCLEIFTLPLAKYKKTTASLPICLGQDKQRPHSDARQEVAPRIPIRIGDTQPNRWVYISIISTGKKQKASFQHIENSSFQEIHQGLDMQLIILFLAWRFYTAYNLSLVSFSGCATSLAAKRFAMQASSGNAGTDMCGNQPRFSAPRCLFWTHQKVKVHCRQLSLCVFCVDSNPTALQSNPKCYLCCLKSTLLEKSGTMFPMKVYQGKNKQ